MNRPAETALHGLLLLCKPKGWTSFDVVRKVKKLVRPAKVGHTGTLDPMATGLLPVTIGEATKLTQWLSGGSKRYRALIQLGLATDTLDAEGRPVQQCPVPTLERSRVEQACRGLVGRLEQTPPMYSAVHHEGRRLYQLARAGVEVERKARQVEVHSLDLIGLETEAIQIEVHCSAGTYVRSLAAQLARDLGTVGHLADLVRTEAAGFRLEGALDPDELTLEQVQTHLLGLERVLAGFERVDVPDGPARRIANGNRLNADELQRIGVSPGSCERVVWFRPPAGVPIVLAEISALGAETAMRILRVLHPVIRGGNVG